jgi:hypothetical protein
MRAYDKPITYRPATAATPKSVSFHFGRSGCFFKQSRQSQKVCLPSGNFLDAPELITQILHAHSTQNSFGSLLMMLSFEVRK